MTSNNIGAGRLTFVNDLNGAIRDNPIAAGLIGLGVAWMCFGGLKGTSLAAKLPRVAHTALGAVGEAAESLGEGMSATRAGAGTVARRAGAALASGAEEAGTIIREAVTSGYDAIAGKKARDASEKPRHPAKASPGVHYATSLQKTIGDAIERQPLLLGALGLAVGVGIASAFPPTEIEKEVLGSQSSATTERVKALATEAVEAAKSRAKDVLEEVTKEAETQGLTPKAATEQLRGVAQKVKAVASSSGEAIKSRLS